MWKIKNNTGGPVMIPGKNVLLQKRQTLELTDDELAALKKAYPDSMKYFDVFPVEGKEGKKGAKAADEAAPRKTSKKKEE